MPLSKIDSDSLNTPITAADLAYTGTLTGSTGIVNIGSGQVYKDASGNVGIGTSSPATLLHVAKTSGTVQVRVSSDTDVSFLATASGADSSAFVAVANDARQWTMRVNGAESDQFQIRDSTAGATRIILDSSGNLLVGTTADPSSSVSGVKICNPGTVARSRWSCGAITTTNNMIAFCNGNGDVGTISVNGSATTYATSSDYRLKNTIAPMTGALAKVALLKPCTYKWNVDGSDGQGFIAHELQEVVEGCVTGEKDAVQEEQYEVTPAVKDEEGNIVTEAVMGTRTVPSYQGIDTSFLVATLTAAIQELKAIVDAQGAEIAALKGATA